MTLTWPFLVPSMVGWGPTPDVRLWSKDKPLWWANRMTLSNVYGCHRSKSSLSLLRGEQLFCVFHIVVKWEKQYWLSPDCHLSHFLPRAYFFSPDVLLSHLLKVGVFPLLSLVDISPLSFSLFCVPRVPQILLHRERQHMPPSSNCVLVCVSRVTPHMPVSLGVNLEAPDLGSWTNLVPCSRSGADHVIMCEVLLLAVSPLTVVSS